jgi:hypothetical protein
MYKQVEKEDEEQMDDNVIDFTQAKLLKAGGSEPPEANWLAKLEPGTVFICGRRGEAIAQEFVVVKHWKTCSLLYSDLNEPKSYVWVNSFVFSTSCILYAEGDSKKNVLDF